MRIRLAVVLAATLLAACSGGSTPGPTARTPPDLAGFLHLPVATPSACPKGVNGTTVGRRSPWVGHVDVSVYLDDGAAGPVVGRVGEALRSTDGVRTVYFESRAEAWAEFQRLYTCSANYPRQTVPASYRLVLTDLTHEERDALVRAISRLPGVAEVSCDPADPCTDVASG